MTISNYIAASDTTAPCGATVWWRLKGDVRTSRLEAEAVARGLPVSMLPAPPTPLVALKAVMDKIAPVGAIVRPLGGGEAGYALLERHLDAQGRPMFTTSWSAWIAPGASTPDTDGGPSDEDMGYAFDMARGTLDGAAIGSWLASVVRRDAHGVPLRDTGGIYFVGEPDVPLMRVVRDALAACSEHIVEFLPTMRTADAADAIMRAVRDDIEKATAELHAEVDQYADDLAAGKKPRASALAKRQGTLRTLEAKLTRYEELLGQTLGQTREKIQDAQNALVRQLMIQVVA